MEAIADLNLNITRSDAVTSKQDTPELCRLCANTDNQLIPIFKGDGLEHNISGKIGKYLPIITVNESDELPSQICYQCASTLLAWHSLYEGCVSADERLRGMLAQNDKAEDEADQNHDIDNTGCDSPERTDIERLNSECNILGDELASMDTGNHKNESVRNTDETGTENANLDRFMADKTNSEQKMFPESIGISLNSSPIHYNQLNGYNALSTKSGNKLCECTEGINRKCSLCVDILRYNFLPMVECHLSTSHTETSISHTDNIGGKCKSSSFKRPKEAKDSLSLRPTRLKPLRLKIIQRNTSSGFVCKICSKICLTARGLLRHGIVHKHHHLTISCNYCTQSFSDDDTKQKHVSEYHRIKPEVPPLSKETELENPTAVENSPSEVSANANDRPNVRPADVDESNTKADELLTTKKFTCSVCSESFDKKPALTRHQRTQHNQASEFTCEHCDKKFADDKLLKRHLNSSHRKKRIKISEANDPFDRWYVFADGQKHLKCDQCKYNSLWYHKGRFLEHYRIHTGEKPYTCDLCKKQFRTKTLLSKHVMFVHEGIKEHACDICGRRFSDKRYMEDHRRIHTGERPYVCDLCGKTFKQSASLFIHKELHKGLRKHHCEMCGKAFTTRSSLTIHIKRHVGERNFICATCGKAFVDGKHLRDHMTVHSEERPFACEQCGSRFKLLKHLKQHGRTHKRDYVEQIPQY